MKSITIASVSMFVLAISAAALAQQREGVWVSQNLGPGPVTIKAGGLGKSAAPVQGAPYSATIKNESIQTLADGNHIKESSTGTVARDSAGRTRQDTMLPAIGNLTAADAPHLVFIHDPVAQKSYTLNLTDKTAHEMPPLPPPPPGGVGPGGQDMLFVQAADGPVVAGQLPVPQAGGVAVAAGPLSALPDRAMNGREIMRKGEKAQVSTEDLGSQTMEGVFVTGVRTTRTIPAGQIGNEKPISIVTEVWTSPDLKTIVYSKRSDPRTGEQIFQLTNISRNEPDASLFAVPSDFKLLEGPGPKTIFYRSDQ
jgi:hypothetical protein